MDKQVKDYQVGDVVRCPYTNAPLPEDRQFPVGATVFFSPEDQEVNEEWTNILAWGVCIATDENAATVEIKEVGSEPGPVQFNMTPE